MQAVKGVLLGLLLFFSALNGAEFDCNYFQNLEVGQTYYAYNPEYPGVYRNQKHCKWEMRSMYAVKINCTIEMGNDCYQNRLSIKFAEGNIFNLCGYKTFSYKGMNPTIKLDSQLFSQGRFLCQIETVNNNCKCGSKKVTRIVGGKETGVNEYPMMCGLVNFYDRMIYCGCTIISEQYVVTAAHCVENKNINNIGIIVGEHDTDTGSDTKATRLFRVNKCITHPWYERNMDAFYDVAVCKTFGSIEFNAEVGPVCLPFQHNEHLFTNNKVTALGWGLMDFSGDKATTLQKVDLNVIPLGKCQNYYTNVNNNNICTFTPGKDTCQMDSGGPLLWQNPITHNLVLAGITSAGVGCASETPAVAMRTGAFMDWILYVTHDAKYCQLE